MFSFLIRRLLWIVPVLIGVATITFILMQVIPGDPAQLLVGQHGDEETLAAIRAELGLDRPVHVQYALFLGRLLKGDLGTSYRQKRPVADIILERFPATLKLALAAIIIAVLAGVSLGCLAALMRGGWLESAIMALSLVGVSAPVFWVGMILIVIFGSGLGWLPVAGYGGGSFRHLVLPSLALSGVFMGYIARFTRSSMIDVLSQDYIRTARAIGLPEWRVIIVHALPNALAPVLTVIGLHFAGLLGGSVATETLFAWPGLGRAVVDAIRLRDIPVVEGGIIFMAAVFVLVNALVDISYGLLDPRVRLGGGGEGGTQR
ncbi:ABC transporter permease [candidate division KSB1 bacterium]